MIYTLLYSVFTTTLCGKWCYCPHITDEKKRRLLNSLAIGLRFLLKRWQNKEQHEQSDSSDHLALSLRFSTRVDHLCWSCERLSLTLSHLLIHHQVSPGNWIPGEVVRGAELFPIDEAPNLLPAPVLQIFTKFKLGFLVPVFISGWFSWPKRSLKT